MEDLLRIKSILVEDLFGIYRHELKLNTDERATIIHGPNGVGKTALLRCISAFFNGRFDLVNETPFSNLEIKLGDGTKISVSRELPLERDEKLASQSSQSRSLVVKLENESDPEFISTSFALSEFSDPSRTAKLIERQSPWISQVDPENYIDDRTQELISAEEVVRRYSERLAPGVLTAEPPLLTDLRKRVKVRFIETNRLYKFEPQPGRRSHRGRSFTNTVTTCASELHAQIESAITQYGRRAQVLDQSFPHRLVQENSPPLSSRELKDRLEQLEARQQELSSIGLLESQPARPLDTASIESITDEKLLAMTLFLKDSEEKISLLSSLSQRIELLLSSINRKFRNKQIAVSREKGLVALAPDGTALSLEALSSGEQHEIVLSYELLFSISRDTLVLIDEPELSLHVNWQRRFLPELLEFANAVGYDAIIATHSPFIVGDRWDLLVPLGSIPDESDDLASERGEVSRR